MPGASVEWNLQHKRYQSKLNLYGEIIVNFR